MGSPREALTAELPLRDFLLYVSANRALLEMVHDTASFSLHVASVMRPKGEAVAEFETSSVGRMSSVARREVEHGFPLLHGQALVGLWGALEACIDDLSVLWLQCMEPQTRSDCLASLRVKLGEYLAVDEDDRWGWILNQLRAGSAVLSPGLGQFENNLNALGVGGQVDPNVRTTLFRAKAMRNLYAHRGGRADTKFLKEWPGHPAGLDEPVVVTRDQVIATQIAMVLYAETVSARILSLMGEPEKEIQLPPWIESTQDLLSLMKPSDKSLSGAPWSFHFEPRDEV